MHQDENVLPFPSGQSRPWMSWLSPLSAVVMLFCTCWLAFFILPEMRSIKHAVQEERGKETERLKLFEDARKRHAIQAASLIAGLHKANTELDRANESVDRLSKEVDRLNKAIAKKGE